MAYFAELDENNTVLRVISISDKDCQDENGNEVEALGIARCKQLTGEHTRWVQTSYNTYAGAHRNGKSPFRKNYAAIGDTYDQNRDAFISPKPDGDFWVFDDDKCIWVDPRPQPEIGVTRVGAKN